MIRRAAGLLLAAALAVAGCDSGPSGPGTLQGVLEAPDQGPVGAALVTVSGDDVRGISPEGSTRAFSSGPAPDGTWRVLLVNTGTAGTLRFGVEVRDVGAAPPAATVVELVDGNNIPVTSVAGARIRFEP